MNFLKKVKMGIGLLMIVGAISVEAKEKIITASYGELSSDVFVAPSPNFIKEWTGTPFSHKPTIPRIHKTRINQMVHIGVLMSGYSLTNDNKVDLHVDMKIFDPKKNIIFNEINYAVNNKKTKGKTGLILSDPLLDFTVEGSDPTGVYRIEVTVRDVVSGKVVSKSYALEVIK